MKVKILLFPLSIVIAITLSIFWIQPEISTIFSLRTQKDAVGARLVEIDQVISNIAALDRSLNENTEDEQFVETYLPKAGSDDRILDEVNFLSGGSGVLLVSTGLKRVSSDAAQVAQQVVQAEADKAEIGSATPESSLLNIGSSSDSAMVFVPSSPKVRVRSTDVSVSALGKYDQIKAFVDKIYRANSFQNFLSVKVSQKAEERQGSASSPAVPTVSDVLSVDMVIRFGFLPSTSVPHGSFLDTFKKPSFNLTTIQDLRSRATSELPLLDVTPPGRANPFLR